jgi:hypothetical protein
LAKRRITLNRTLRGLWRASSKHTEEAVARSEAREPG